MAVQPEGLYNEVEMVGELIYFGDYLSAIDICEC